MCDEVSAQLSPRSFQRFSIWLVTSISFAIVLNIWLADRQYPGDAQSLLAPWAVLLLGASVVGVWFQFRFARVAYLAILTLFALSAVSEGIASVPFLISAVKGNASLRGDVGFWWDLTAVIRWIIWLALNAWLMLNARAHQFFRRGGT